MTAGQADREARWYERRADGKSACQLCPHHCIVTETHPGTCGVRLNRGGTLVLPFYGRISSLAVDPIEKKPLYHFYPGSRILSAGFVGCSFHCNFCQNWQISQTTDDGNAVHVARGPRGGGTAGRFVRDRLHVLGAAGPRRICHRYAPAWRTRRD